MKTNYMQLDLFTILKVIARKIKNKFFIHFIITALIILAAQTAHAQSFNLNLAAKLQDTLDYMVSINPSTKGVSASVYCPGQGIWQGVSGISYVGVPINPEMEFSIASNSKLFTAVIMLMLAEDHIINLDDAISTYIPNFTNVDPSITIRQLLNHTSGVADMYITQPQLDSVAADPNRIWTPVEVLSWIGAPQFAPGGGFYYSNTNYILAGMIAESATGYHISQLIRDSILTPLNLDSTFYDVQETVLGVKAHPWKSGVDINNIPRTSLNSAIGPAGSIYTTPNEMAKWYIALMNEEIINANSLTEMTTFGATSNYGLGISKFTFNASTVWGHGGIIDGYRSRSIYDPCREVFVFGNSNSNPSGVDGLTVILHKVLVDNLPGCPGAITGITTLCQGTDSITYSIPTITNTTSYVWTLPNGVTGFSNTNSITVNFGLAAVSGNIEVKGINMYGESATIVLAVTVNNLPPTPTVTLAGNILQSNAVSGNQWYDDNGIIVGATNQDYLVTANGNYYVIVTLNGCSSAPSSTFSTTLGIDNTIDNNILNVYPNPNNGIFKVSAASISEGTLFIYNTLGQQIYQTTNWTNEINLSAYPKGTYYARLITDGKGYSRKIILQ